MEDFEVILKELTTPIMVSFDAVIDAYGKRQLIKSFSIKESEKTIIGEIDGSLYIMPVSRQLETKFPQKRNDLVLSSCQVGSPLFPDCVIGVQYEKGLIKHGLDPIPLQISNMTLAATIFLGVFVLLVFLYSRFSRLQGDKREVFGSGPISIKVSDKVLGVGSHGTVVYSGFFEGRQVAVKRLLKEFYNLAEAEVKLLQESDSHHNVVRYFFKEDCHEFTYLALELCPASLYDIVERIDLNHDLNYIWNAIDRQTAIHQILSGLKHLHSLNIVHRDIKPQVNILA